MRALADVECRLELEIDVAQVWPVHANGNPQRVSVVQSIRHLRERNRAPLPHLEQFAQMLPLARAALAAANQQHAKVISLLISEYAACGWCVRDFGLWQHGTRD